MHSMALQKLGIVAVCATIGGWGADAEEMVLR